jgi:hypothetical protein
MQDEIERGYFSRVVNNQWVTLGRSMLGCSGPRSLHRIRSAHGETP